jgi:hypothetical protein
MRKNETEIPYVFLIVDLLTEYIRFEDGNLAYGRGITVSNGYTF